jgi:hypothetical protein
MGKGPSQLGDSFLFVEPWRCPPGKARTQYRRRFRWRTLGPATRRSSSSRTWPPLFAALPSCQRAVNNFNIPCFIKFRNGKMALPIRGQFSVATQKISNVSPNHLTNNIIIRRGFFVELRLHIIRSLNVILCCNLTAVL